MGAHSMRVEQAWAAMRALPVCDYNTAFGAKPVLVLAPHPDDESLGCGGLIADACARGLPPVVVVLTDGTGSHPHSMRYPAPILRDLRENEALEATARLGLPPGHVVFLRQVDTAAPMQGEAFQSVVARLVGLVQQWGIGTVVVSWRHDPHCDHEAAAAIAEAACRATGVRLLAYPVWGWTLPPDQQIGQGPVSGFRLDITPHVEAKRAAILSHRSQYAGLIDDDPAGFQLQDDFIDRFLHPTEVYMDVSP